MNNRIPDYYDPNDLRRKYLKVDAKGSGENCALLNFIICRLNRGKMKLKAILDLGTEQGYTLSATRHALQRLAGAKLIDYVHIDPAVYVELNDDGQQFAAEVMTHE